MEDVYQFVEDSPFVIAFADADARLLEIIGETALREELDAIGWAIGMCWSEDCAGTNGLALALLESFPVQVVGPEHYLPMLEPYCTTAAPVYDSTGSLIGALVAVSPNSQGHTQILGMMSAAASSLSAELRMNLWLTSANDLLAEMNAILQTLSEGIMLLQRDGTITHMTARAGHLLRLASARVTGRRMSDVLDMPAQLAQALRVGRELHDEELIFQVGGERIACVCTLHMIAGPDELTPVASLAGLPDVETSGRGGLSVSPHSTTAGFVLTLRSIARIQRLVQRMSGAQALMHFSNIIGESESLLEAARLARIAADSSSTVLLHGETGTGKEVFAQAIHNGSARAEGPFVAINCAAIPRELISSELFGYEGGAFTGADRHGRPGKFELANGGTLFLDEVGDMPHDLQTSLLRAIETRAIVRVGGTQMTPVDVRIIAATHKDLAEEVPAGNFRSDLFFRLNVFPIVVPALRDRPGDVGVLLRHILQRLSTRLNRELSLNADVLLALEIYDWPGNVRELENVVERAVYVSEDGIIGLGDLPETIRNSVGQHIRHSPVGQLGAVGTPPLLAPAIGGRSQRRLAVGSETAEAAMIRQALHTSGGNIQEAATQLGISRTTLWRKRRRYQV
ncbi:MAG TPA: sigma 54-interacting transcriptional regulator [Ktedonobacterales bacterium]|nr:sigma 54-interacting transcriptional regulator [Ktedonobacterales bacterium]